MYEKKKKNEFGRSEVNSLKCLEYIVSFGKL